MWKVQNILQCILLVLVAAVLSSGCEGDIPLSTELGHAGQVGVDLRVVNSFTEEMEVAISACGQRGRIESGTTAVIDCPLEDALTPFEVEIAWPGTPRDAQGVLLFPPQTAIVAAGQVLHIGIAPEGVSGGFRIRVAGP